MWIGATIGSILAMIIGRYLLREYIAKKATQYKIFGAIDGAIEKEVIINPKVSYFYLINFRRKRFK